MFCLDSSFIVDLIEGDKKAVEKFEKLQDFSLVTTSINVFELLKGSKNKEKRKFLENFFNDIEVINFDFISAQEASKIKHELSSDGNIINDFDILIAGIVRHFDIMLVTR